MQPINSITIPMDVLPLIFIECKKNMPKMTQVCTQWHNILNGTPHLSNYLTAKHFKIMCLAREAHNEKSTPENKLPSIKKIPKCVIELFGGDRKAVEFIYNLPNYRGHWGTAFPQPIGIDQFYSGGQVSSQALALKINCSIGSDVGLHVFFNSQTITKITFPYVTGDSPVDSNATLTRDQLQKLINQEGVEMIADKWFKQIHPAIDSSTISYSHT